MSVEGMRDVMPDMPKFTPDDLMRLQVDESVPTNSKMWVGTPDKLQAVWVTAEMFRIYVNRLLDAFGDTPYDLLDNIAKSKGK